MHFGFLQSFAKFINYIVKLSFFSCSLKWFHRGCVHRTECESEQEVSRTGGCELVVG